MQLYNVSINISLAVSVQLHILSSQSSGMIHTEHSITHSPHTFEICIIDELGLFHNGISQSGSIGSPWSFQRSPARQARIYAEKLNCPVFPVLEMVKCMKSASPKSLMDANKGFQVSQRNSLTE